MNAVVLQYIYNKGTVQINSGAIQIQLVLGLGMRRTPVYLLDRVNFFRN